MSQGLLGRKVGMTRIFTKNGESIPITVLDVSKNYIIQIKIPEIDGYSAIQVSCGQIRPSKINKAIAGHYAKSNVLSGSFLKEFLIDSKEVSKIKIGDLVSINLFDVGQKVDVRGISIGKGYSGVIKRYGFSSGRASRGNSCAHNVPGSIGMSQDPGRVFPGKRMSGHLGNTLKTIQNLKIIKIDYERQLLFIKGSVPGARNGKIIVTHAIKNKVNKVI
ncbi:50S ribosomal protein L3 [Candidatus Profftella armatura]|uniref:Large ribosomal subunit protein uL3 n=1 Tax=Candidatus Profftella armatura TaxID=669502 RepID=S5RLA2_9PROT|nr:50S ribosomal protein L3 [Candidatus Profftella armatura]AGS06726.1 50S ribosomal protein L3 [Candidatus Profftella armatura]ALC95845.1 50S ribosomal protein L3 [Candidatus Profftella armatura]